MTPKRKYPRKATREEVRRQQDGKCGCRKRCGKTLPPDGKGLVQYQHDPPLNNRVVNEDGTDWIPPQHDTDYLYAELAACHARETNEGRSGATVLGSDRHNIDKTKRTRGETKTKPVQKIRSAGFRKVYRPMRAR